MGSTVEINDTLQITTEQGFPADVLDLDCHTRTPVTAEQLKDREFTFHGKPGARLFQLAPVRVYLVQNISGKWLFWGKIAIIEQSIARLLIDGQAWKEGQWQTSGRYTILDVYEPAYQLAFTRREAPAGLSYL